LRIKTKEFEIAGIGVEEGVHLGSAIKDFVLLPNVVLPEGGGTSFVFQCGVSGQHQY
jgi:hypothetical protein